MSSSGFLDGTHPLLSPESPPYSNATVRRAFIVWMHCGQRNSFKDVCNYYHHLEMLEEQLPASRRASSRHHEFNMFSHPPPTSPYLDTIFPKLYTTNTTIQHYIKKADIKTEPAVFKLEEFADSQKYVTPNQIVDTSHMIKKYCKSHMIPLGKFLNEFKDYARKCNLNYTVNNVAFYIKRKMVEEELLMVQNYSKSLKYLKMAEIKSDELKRERSRFALRNPVNPLDHLKVNENQLKFLSAINIEKPITVLTRDKTELMKRYWNDLTANYVEMNANNNYSHVTRT